MSILVKRCISGFLLVVLMVGGALWNGWSLLVLLMVIQIVGLLEFYKLAEAVKYNSYKIAGALLGVLTILLLFIDLHFNPFRGFLLAGLSFIIPILSIYLRNNLKKAFLGNLAVTVFGCFYLTIPMSLLLLISYKNGFFGGSLVLFVLTLVWVNDSMAYVTGKTFGRHLLASDLSPGKTLEGTAGGILFSGIGGMLWVWMDLIALGLGQAIISGVLIGIGAVLGDLFQSALKRKAGWDDTGNLIPGHGGMLDRFDGLLVSVPLAFPLLYFW